MNRPAGNFGGPPPAATSRHPVVKERITIKPAITSTARSRTR
ncbi:MAG TPA: hypothetical protein VKH46_13075 [Thermoanaerobaculia bacterium]|nr:hypothetical protein [Thermoanaerobaculia bacterium]